MQTSQTPFVPDLDLSPPTSWSKPASALGLSNSLNNLSQTQQVQRLQQQIERHRQLQRNTLHGYSSTKMINAHDGNRDSNTDPSTQDSEQLRHHGGTSIPCQGASEPSHWDSQHRHSFHPGKVGSASGGDVQHINVQNMDGDSDMSGDDRDGQTSHEDLERRSNSSRGSSYSDNKGFYINRTSPNNHIFHHHRSPSSLHNTHGFGGLQGFTPISPGPSISASSYGSFTSDGNSFSAPVFSSGLLAHHKQGVGHHYDGQSLPYQGNHHAGLTGSGGVGRVESMPLHPQSLPAIFQNQAMTTSTFVPGGQNDSSSNSNGNGVSLSTFTSALGQQLQLERLQQQQQQQQQQDQQQQQQQPSTPQDEGSLHRPGTMTKPILPPAPRSLPARPPQASAPRRYLGRQARKPIIKTIVTETATPERRMAHIFSEQKRREKINDGFEELRSVIPDCADNTDTKATILRKAVDRILELEREIRRHVDLYNNARDSHDEKDD
ncbi:hypothetical protein BC939DRAFT_529049 [Gamsiella multidivaricata]|uniref:uncharacterized protein n=1 Tax=Gamsiella multidivaricata TaxID=101098 RepID=UPI00221FBF5A|nr:uncharacterized protein BC939DRAFT_529049 [Gamsiella multidivaricata]KAG0367602.1 hypothetical protein BGZ54_003601 [Gamsiella multidivaricata]KAI7823381.1 hypothetical protein BC939DRAFT_529049 [Gamsiella multidivaricata]